MTSWRFIPRPVNQFNCLNKFANAAILIKESLNFMVAAKLIVPPTARTLDRIMAEVGVPKGDRPLAVTLYANQHATRARGLYATYVGSSLEGLPDSLREISPRSQKLVVRLQRLAKHLKSRPRGMTFRLTSSRKRLFMNVARLLVKRASMLPA